jgi:hypothetical protein
VALVHGLLDCCVLVLDCCLVVAAVTVRTLAQYLGLTATFSCVPDSMFYLTIAPTWTKREVDRSTEKDTSHADNRNSHDLDGRGSVAADCQRAIH